MRKLATIQTISDIRPIDGADSIDVATVKGWNVVVKKGEFTIGSKVVYLEIDSWVPNSVAPFLSKNEPREYEGVKGERLKTVKLRGQISQGLILPLSVVPLTTEQEDDTDVSEILGVIKWEAPISANLSGQVKGSFPGFLRKTDEERIQNLTKLFTQFVGTRFNLHEKLDGSSLTCYRHEGEFGVCSRNLQLKENEDNAFWQAVNQYGLKEKLPDGYCIQGELIGPGVQGNKYGLNKLDVYVFNVYDIKEGKYLNINEAKQFATSVGLKWVPFIQDYEFTENTTLDELLQLAEGKSVLNANTEREGLVWRPYEEQEIRNLGRLSFKTISNRFLLKNGD